jgi:hypothetical protein
MMRGTRYGVGRALVCETLFRYKFKWCNALRLLHPTLPITETLQGSCLDNCSCIAWRHLLLAPKAPTVGALPLVPRIATSL